VGWDVSLMLQIVERVFGSRPVKEERDARGFAWIRLVRYGDRLLYGVRASLRDRVCRMSDWVGGEL
jgi:hypothetical protein